MGSQLFSAQQLADFNRDGFVIIRGLCNPEEVRQLTEWTDELARRPLEAGKLMAYFEQSLKKKEERVLSRIEKFLEFHQPFNDFIHSPKILGRISQLLDTPAVVFKEKINFKLPGGDGFKPHQDIQSGWLDYVDFFLTGLISIDDSTVENGCLELAAGQHRRGWIGQLGKPLEGAELTGLEFKKYPMQPGDAVFFDVYVPHQSAPNLTDSPRRNLYVTFNRAIHGNHREKYFSDKRESYPPDHERVPGKTYSFKV